MDPFLILILFVMLVLFAAAIFLIGIAIWAVLRFVLGGMRIGDSPKPDRQSLKRVRSFFKAKGPAQTIIQEAQPDVHGDGAWLNERATYPEGFR